MAGCNYRNPLLRAGVSQLQRVLLALVPDYAKVDERDYADLALFAKEYARYLNYYNDVINTDRREIVDADGDWVMLMKMDVSVTLATIAKPDSKKCFAYFDFLINTILQTDSANLADLKKYYKAIYEFIYSLVYWLDEEWQHLPPDVDFTEYAGNMINSRMNELFWKITEYFKQSGLINLLNDDPPILPVNAPIDINSILSLQTSPLSDIWDYVPVTPFVLPVEGSTDADKIKYIAQHSIFKGTIELFLKSLISLTQKAGLALDSTLQTYPNHSPHYALYLTFIQLFRYAQTHLNDYTGRHLNFYYKDVLQLKNAPAVPDDVHLVIELAKYTDAHLVAKNTVFKAGKDADGIEIFYGATDDVVVNKGQVQCIKSLLRKNETISGVDHLKIYVAPVTNSGDGKGGALTSADKSWKPFGDASQNDLARTGFSIAHSILYMKEGVRVITITLNCNDLSALKPHESEIKNWFKVRMTGAKAWIDLTIKDSAVYLYGQNQLVLQVELTIDKPAVVPYSEKIHAAGYQTDLPVMEFAVNTDVVFHDPHVIMDLVQVNNITIQVDVSGVKDVSIQNELSPLDSAKPFDMFGPQPHLGSSFIIGSKEIFLKNKDAQVDAVLNIDWDKMDPFKVGGPDVSPIINKNVRVKYLHNGIWNNIAGDQVIFYHNYPSSHVTVDGNEYHVHLSQTLQLNLPVFDNEFDSTANAAYNINSATGFMKIEFIGPTDFGHGDYIQRFTQASLDKTTLPPQPYTPTLKSFTLDYSATAGLDMNSFMFLPLLSFTPQLVELTTENFILNELLPIVDIFSTGLSGNKVSGSDGHFYHLLPFGHARKTGSFQNLLPAFNDEGTMYVGLEQFKANQSIQILFQLSDGSANPLKDRQNIQWSYLSKNNDWKNFDDKSVSDATNDLTQTGIIKFGFPDDATDVTSAFTEQIFWIRGAVAHDTDAVCNIIQLYAQAIKAQFIDYLKKSNYYKNILPDSTISKLVVTDSTIKKIQQPYASFGGRVVESDGAFHIRVSERLRHKNRGITMWDYEHLVLQNFPEIYKVKCINHTSIKLVGDIESDNELAPGHVVVVPVPDLRNKNAIDPLKPMTSIGTLVNINEFLKKHISPFVQLQVKNARFEEIQLDFRVKFNNEDGAFYHEVLRDEIVQFLSPWAFVSGADLSFGGSVYKSVLLNFVEERPYVDFVTCFKMFHWVDGVKSTDVDEAVATSARSVLVSYGGSATSDKHIIDYVNYDCNC